MKTLKMAHIKKKNLKKKPLLPQECNLPSKMTQFQVAFLFSSPWSIQKPAAITPHSFTPISPPLSPLQTR